MENCKLIPALKQQKFIFHVKSGVSIDQDYSSGSSPEFMVFPTTPICGSQIHTPRQQDGSRDKEGREVSLSFWAAVTKYQRLVTYEQHTLTSHSSEGWKSEIRVPAG